MAMLDARKIWSSSQLPSLPVVAVRLLELSRDPDTDIKDIVELIRTDPAISAKILKATNSTFFGFSTRVTSIDKAVPLLGTTVVTSLALSFSLVEAAMTSGATAEFYSAYWLQSIVQGAAAESLSQYTDQGLACEYFLAGLLMDIGRLAMLKTISEQYVPVIRAARDQQRDLIAVEQEMLGLDHTEIGFELMRNWNLPETLRNALKCHHASLEEIQSQQPSADSPLIQTIAVASSIGDYFCSSNKGQALDRLRKLTSTFYNVSETDLENLLARVKQRIDQTAEMFSVNTTELGDPSDLMAQASEHLAQLAMREHVASTMATARQKVVEQEKQDLQSQNEQLQQQALHDPLTKIYNRHFFDETLSKEVMRCCREANPLGVIFIDVDKFKNLNDTFGHQFGDVVLKRVATIISEVLRSADTLARYGGEEFVILVNQPTEKGLQKLAERIRARVEAERVTSGTTPVPVTVSVGAAITIPKRNDLAIGAQVVAAADEAMYEAKQGGRNQVRIHQLISEADRRLVQLVTQRRFSRWLVNRGILDITNASKALLNCQTPHVQIGELATKLKMLGAAQIDLILTAQQRDGNRFGEAALALGFLTEAQLAELLAFQQEDPRVLASCLIKQGLIDTNAAQTLLKQYWAERDTRSATPATAGASA